jgi:hypothetical protein
MLILLNLQPAPNFFLETTMARWLVRPCLIGCLVCTHGLGIECYLNRKSALTSLPLRPSYFPDPSW